jgi:hypothetical protein
MSDHRNPYIDRLAQRIARDLFTAESGERALYLRHYADDRLPLTYGWSEGAMADRIAKHLNRSLSKRRKL